MKTHVRPKMWIYVGLCLLVGFSLFVVGIGEFALTGSLAPHRHPVSTKVVGAEGYRLLAGCLFLLAIGAIIAWARFDSRVTVLLQRLGLRFHVCLVLLALAVTSAVLARNWHFDLDDKWVYYRTSLNSLRYGLPYWNPQDAWNVQASTAWAYVTIPGHLVGNWELYAKVLGLLSTLGFILLCVTTVQDRGLKALSAVGVLLFFPLVLWSIGGLETAFACFYLGLASWLLLHRGPTSYLAWALLGGVMFVRPDTVLIGAGAFGVAFLFGRGDFTFKQKCIAALCFAVPVLAYLGFNLTFFGKPFPGPYYVKGLNKAFSGHVPLHYDIWVGSTHLLSALGTNLLLATIVFLGIGCGFRSRGLFRTPSLWLIAGSAAHLAYVILCGYQHMNFTFRYYLPSMMVLYLCSLKLLDQYLRDQESQPEETVVPRVLGLCTLLQLPLALFLGFYAAKIDFSLTRAPQRDIGSVDSWASFMASWLEAADYLKETVTESDKIFLYQDLAAASLTDAYVLDQFYFPIPTSSFREINDALQAAGSGYQFQHFEYILAFPDDNFISRFPYHYLTRKYFVGNTPTLAILRRK